MKNIHGKNVNMKSEFYRYVQFFVVNFFLHVKEINNFKLLISYMRRMRLLEKRKKNEEQMKTEK